MIEAVWASEGGEGAADGTCEVPAPGAGQTGALLTELVRLAQEGKGGCRVSEDKETFRRSTS